MNSPYTTLTPRLIVRSATEAMKTYVDVLGAEAGMMIRDPSGRVVHAELSLGGLVMSLSESDGSDHARDPQQLGGTPVVLALMNDDPDALAARATEQGWEVVFPIADRAYGMRDGRLQDPFGHQWLVTRQLEELSEEELQSRLDDAPLG